MSRFFAFAVSAVGASVGLAWGPLVGCSSSTLSPTSGLADASAIRRDSAPVDPAEGGGPLDAGTTPPPSCAKYCDLVMENCVGANAQYASKDDCLAFCAHLPLSEPAREADEATSATIACRQYWADTPARTSPTYCLAAGPFGGNACGDRCTAFCDVLISACSPDGGVTAYATAPECASACASFTYRDAGADGGGEGPAGPSVGNSLNCRLYHLRAATKDAGACAALAPQSDACAD